MEIKLKHYLSFVVLGLVIVFSLGFHFESEAEAAKSTSNSIQDLKIDTVDGVKYSPDKHKKIAGIVVEITNHGKRILGFSTEQKYEAYHQQVKELSPNTNIGITAKQTNYFYENINGRGSMIWLDSGRNRPYVGYPFGHWWNDRISSIGVASGSWVRLYKDINYGGQWISFSNQTNTINYINLTSYTGWNDQTTSIATGKYH